MSLYLTVEAESDELDGRCLTQRTKSLATRNSPCEDDFNLDPEPHKAIYKWKTDESTAETTRQKMNATVPAGDVSAKHYKLPKRAEIGRAHV